jgi:hypothetical protein
VWVNGSLYRLGTFDSGEEASAAATAFRDRFPPERVAV